MNHILYFDQLNESYDSEYRKFILRSIDICQWYDIDVVPLKYISGIRTSFRFKIHAINFNSLKYNYNEKYFTEYNFSIEFINNKNDEIDFKKLSIVHDYKNPIHNKNLSLKNDEKNVLLPKVNKYYEEFLMGNPQSLNTGILIPNYMKDKLSDIIKQTEWS